MFRTARSVTAAQLRKLWASARSLGWGDQEVHQLVRELTGKASLRALTMEEAARVIDRLVGAGAPAGELRVPSRSGPHQSVPGNVIELMTAKQLDMINRLLWHLGWRESDPYFRACVTRAIGHEWIRTKPDASKVINMLRGKVKALGLESDVAESRRRTFPDRPTAPAPDGVHDTDEDDDEVIINPLDAPPPWEQAK